jgi:hypothetical protein
MGDSEKNIKWVTYFLWKPREELKVMRFLTILAILTISPNKHPKLNPMFEKNF